MLGSFRSVKEKALSLTPSTKSEYSAADMSNPLWQMLSNISVHSRAHKTFTQFAGEVEDLATKCEFDTKSYIEEHTMRDAITLGTSDEKLPREALAKDADHTTLGKTALGYENHAKAVES